MWKEIKNKLSSTESVVSLVLGIVIVLVAGALLFNVVKNKSMSGKSVLQALTGQTSTSETPTGENTAGSMTLPAKYTVKEGDDLCSIAVAYYKSGYNWTVIAAENKLVDPNLLVAGQELTIPKADPIMPEGSVNGEGTQTLKGDSYTVAKGDSLWDISCRAYADCYKWVDIAKANNLAHPSWIEVGQELKLPR
ncbi:LysM peptidoglycan-binding domain-containing protein [Candidatus Gottesmanbacteria bacterium]|nr:LysM peptidoglycan-binding domain-containing protein [Candidatus Gottesmanbacteria bacterium]